jgi:hypothetical protein
MIEIVDTFLRHEICLSKTVREALLYNFIIKKEMVETNTCSRHKRPKQEGKNN